MTVLRYPRPTRFGRCSDAEVVARIVRREEGALGELYDRYAPELLVLALGIVRTQEVAEDIVHDVFLEAWRKVEAFAPERGAVRTWLVVRTRSRAIDHMRSPWARRIAPLDDLPDEPSDPDDAPRAVDGGFALRAAANLESDVQRILALAYVEGLTLSEVACELDLPIGTVKSRLWRALRELRASLGEEGDPTPRRAGPPARPRCH